jgi:transposase
MKNDKRLQLLARSTELFDNNCEGCRISIEIEKAHGYGNREYYCGMLCPIGKQLREIGKQLDLEKLQGKDLELNKSNLRIALEKGLSNEQLENIFGISKTTIARKKREWNLTAKNYNSGLTKELYKQERANGLSRLEVAAKYNMGKRTLQRKITEWGII